MRRLARHRTGRPRALKPTAAAVPLTRERDAAISPRGAATVFFSDWLVDARASKAVKPGLVLALAGARLRWGIGFAAAAIAAGVMVSVPIGLAGR